MKVTSGGVEIVYDDFGNGEPSLLFMPGWCCDRRVFDDLVLRSRVHHRTLALDLLDMEGQDHLMMISVMRLLYQMPWL